MNIPDNYDDALAKVNTFYYYVRSSGTSETLSEMYKNLSGYCGRVDLQFSLSP